MPHIIDTIRNKRISQVVDCLALAHGDLLKSIRQADIYSKSPNQWGIEMKRLSIDLTSLSNSLITKKSEKFVELINIIATVERTLDTLKWAQEKYPMLIVEQCHASTSDDPEGNDIVLIDIHKKVKVRIEVCDVASNKASQNGKEKSDIKNLGCASGVPDDGVERYIATSSEFANALSSPNRKWASICYRYYLINVFNTSTILLKLISREK